MEKESKTPARGCMLCGAKLSSDFEKVGICPTCAAKVIIKKKSFLESCKGGELYDDQSW